MLALHFIGQRYSGALEVKSIQIFNKCFRTLPRRSIKKSLYGILKKLQVKILHLNVLAPFWKISNHFISLGIAIKQSKWENFQKYFCQLPAICGAKFFSKLSFLWLLVLRCFLCFIWQTEQYLVFASFRRRYQEVNTSF